MSASQLHRWLVAKGSPGAGASVLAAAEPARVRWASLQRGHAKPWPRQLPARAAARRGAVASFAWRSSFANLLRDLESLPGLSTGWAEGGGFLEEEDGPEGCQACNRRRHAPSQGSPLRMQGWPKSKPWLLLGTASAATASARCSASGEESTANTPLTSSCARSKPATSYLPACSAHASRKLILQGRRYTRPLAEMADRTGKADRRLSRDLLVVSPGLPCPALPWPGLPWPALPCLGFLAQLLGGELVVLSECMGPQPA